MTEALGFFQSPMRITFATLQRCHRFTRKGAYARAFPFSKAAIGYQNSTRERALFKFWRPSEEFLEPSEEFLEPSEEFLEQWDYYSLLVRVEIE